MPLFFSLEEKEFQLAVWKMDEELEELLHASELSDADLARANSFQHVARKKEWICIRLLLKKLGRASRINYLESGKPFLENSSAHISIAHTKDFAGLIISDHASVGIDLERIHPRIEKIAHKFVSDEEDKLLHGNHHLEKLFVIWGVKEVLFKMHSIGELLFKEHLLVNSFDFHIPGNASAKISKSGFQKDFLLNYTMKDDLLITWCQE